MNDFEKAALYAVSQLDETEIDYALHQMDKCRIPAGTVSGISEKICDCMEEYGDDNDLPEGWWLEYGDEDDVLFTGLNLKNKN